jgi:hypothetical protein
MGTEAAAAAQPQRLELVLRLRQTGEQSSQAQTVSLAQSRGESEITADLPTRSSLRTAAAKPEFGRRKGGVLERVLIQW